MAIDLGKETVELARTERTWRVTIFCDRGEDPRVEALREVISTRPDGTVAERVTNIVTSRRLSQFADQKVGGVTGQQLAGLIAMFADAWRQEDIDAAEKAEAERAAAQKAATDAEAAAAAKAAKSAKTQK